MVYARLSRRRIGSACRCRDARFPRLGDQKAVRMNGPCSSKQARLRRQFHPRRTIRTGACYMPEEPQTPAHARLTAARTASETESRTQREQAWRASSIVAVAQAKRSAMSVPIEDYGIIGNAHTAAL